MLKTLLYFIFFLGSLISSAQVCLICPPPGGGGGPIGGGVTVTVSGPSPANADGASYRYSVSVSGGSHSATSYSVSGGFVQTSTKNWVDVVWTSSGLQSVTATALVGGNFYNDSHPVFVNAAPPPPAHIDPPTATQETNRTTTSFRANWNSVSGATGYRIQVATNTSFSNMVLNLTTSGTNRTVTGLVPGKNYYYRVYSYNNDATSDPSNRITANTSINPPLVSGATNRGTTGFTANWGAISGISSFRLDVSTNSSFSSYVSGYQNKSVTGSSHQVSGLDPGRNYYYRLRAVGSHHTSNSSTYSSTSTTINAPAVSAESNKTTTSFRANWGSVSGANSYRLDVASNSSFTAYVTGYQNRSVSGTNHTVSGLTSGKNYFYRVRAVGPNHTSANSGTNTANTIMAVPSAANESNRTTTSFRANWNAASGATKYLLYVSTASNFSSHLSGYNGRDVGNVTNFTIPSLTPGKNYYYRLRAVGQHHTSNYSNTITANTSINPPLVSGATNRGTTGFTANWGAISGVSSFRLDVSTNSSFSSYVSGYQNKSVTGSSHQVSGLDPGRNYYYRLRAVGSHHTSNSSAYGSTSTTINAPAVSAESNKTTTSFRANWGSVSGANSYRLDVASNSSFTAYVTGYQNRSVSGTNHTVSGLTSGKNYFYRVRAVGPNHTSANSGTNTANTIMAVPSAANESNRTTTSFRANWNAASGATKYLLYVSTASNFSSHLSGYNGRDVGNVTNFTIPSLTPGKNYYYRLRAVGQHHTSNYSNTITANTSINPPLVSGATNRGTTGFTANWGGISGISSFRLDVSTNSSFSSYVSGYQNKSVTGSSHQVSGLDPGRNYHYRLRAVGSHHTSNSSTYSSTSTTINAPAVGVESNRTATSFRANWSSVGGVDSYELDVATSSNFAAPLVLANQVVSGQFDYYEVSGLMPGKNYFYRVRAVGPDYTSAYSGTNEANTTMPAPARLEATNNSSNAFTARWGAVSGAVSYRIDVSATSNFSSVLPDYNNRSVSGTSLNVNIGLAPGSNYYYRLRAEGPNHTSGSNGITTTNTTIGVPTALEENNKTNTSFDARWNSVTGASSYRLDVSTSSTFANFVSGYDNLTLTGTSRTVSGLSTGRTYYYRVRAVGPNITSDNSTRITANTTINTPSITSEDQRTTTSFRARWNSVPGATKYYLDVSTTIGFSTFVAGYNSLDVGNFTSMVVTGLDEGRNYYYRVRARGFDLNSSNSTTEEAPTDIAVPARVEETSNSSTSFTARWGSVNGATEYRIDVSESSSFNSYVSGYQDRQVAGVLVSLTISGLVPGRDYYYRVRAAGPDVTSVSNGTTTAHTTIAAPSQVQEANNSPTGFTARWGSVAGAASYLLDVATVSDFSTKVSGYNNINVGNVTSYPVTVPTAGKNYYYRVRAVGQDHTSIFSNDVTAHTTMNSPVANDVNDREQTAFIASWTTVAGAQSYSLQVATDNAFSNIVYTTTVTGTSRNVTGVTTGNFYYRVRANGTDVNSTYSAYATVVSALIPGTLSYDVIACQGEAIGTIEGTAAQQGTGVYTYQWEKQDGPDWEILENGDVQSYNSFELLNGPTTFRRRVTDSNGRTTVTSNLTISPTQCSLPVTNYVKTETFRVPVTDASTISAMNHPQKTTSIAYVDALGRSMQSVAAQAGPNQEDVIGFTKYDRTTGKVSDSYLPYTVPSNNPGAYRHGYETEQAMFYQQGGELASDTRPFSTTTSEDSPLGRVKSIMAPGETYLANDKKTTYDYFFYNGTSAGTVNEVVHWEIGSSGYPERATAYSSNSLRVVEVTTPDGRRSQTITDGRGLQIVSRTWDGSAWNSTHNVYDDLGRLRFIIPPKLANKTVPLTTDEINGFLFEYQYDQRGRTIASRSPGAGWNYAVYDRWNRPVMTRHDGQKDANDNVTWSFVKYDIFNRSIVSGIVTTSKTRATLQSELDAATAGQSPAALRYEEVVTDAVGYSLNQTFPDLTHADFDEYELHSVSYFDNYNFKTYPNWDVENRDLDFDAPTGFTGTETNAVLGLATGSKVRILGTNTWLNSVVYYDDRLRAIQAVTENHVGGTDRMTSELDYIGQVQKSLLQHTGQESVDVLSEYIYDHVGRLLQTYETVGDAPRTMVADYKYNALGELVEKNIHSMDNGGSFLQSVDYRYTINQQLKSINNAQLTVGDEVVQDIFGMELSYTEGVTVNGTNIAPSFDGNITSVSWQNGTPSGAQTYEESIYGYSYTPLNQLASASFATKTGSIWGGSGGHFDMAATYDANGNTSTLTRKEDGTTIDNLDYTYDANSNKLTGVEDLSGREEGMDDYFTAPSDYQYDEMGNRTYDLNKRIQSISYNHLQLVERIVFEDQTTIQNSYDATGIRLTKEVLDGNGNSISRTDYLGMVEYLDDAINQVFIEGGRAYKQNDSYYNEYFMADHQSNNRVAFGDLPDRMVYTASMEMTTLDGNPEEESEFAFPVNAMRIAPNHTPMGHRSIALNSTDGRTVGPAKVLAIESGDQVHLQVWARYAEGGGVSSSPVGDVVNALLSTLGLSTSDGAAGDAINGAIGSGGSADYTALSNPGDRFDAPDAYLQYLFFDTNYNFVAANSGFVRVSASSLDTFEKLEVANGLSFAQDGHLFVYVASEGVEDQEVYFDDLHIVHDKTMCSVRITQINEYYPYGLPTANSWRSPGYIDPGLLYQSSYASYDSLTGYYDFLSRSYDPALGQFFQVDPAGQFSSPYNGMGNSPHMMIDPTGEIAWFVPIIIGAAIGGTAKGIQHANNGGTFLGGFWRGALIGGAAAATGIGASAWAAGAGTSFSAVATGSASLGFGATVAGGAAGGFVSGGFNSIGNSNQSFLGGAWRGAVLGGAMAGATYGIKEGIGSIQEKVDARRLAEYRANNPVPGKLDGLGLSPLDTSPIGTSPNSLIPMDPALGPATNLGTVATVTADPYSVGKSLIGTAYQWGGISLCGIDCSGFVLKSMGITDHSEWTTGTYEAPPGNWKQIPYDVQSVGMDQDFSKLTSILQKKDLLVWEGHHTAFYAGKNNGVHQLLHAFGPKGNPARISDHLFQYLRRMGAPTVYRNFPK